MVLKVFLLTVSLGEQKTPQGREAKTARTKAGIITLLTPSSTLFAKYLYIIIYEVKNLVSSFTAVCPILKTLFDMD